jgi:hypothetical protein
MIRDSYNSLSSRYPWTYKNHCKFVVHDSGCGNIVVEQLVVHDSGCGNIVVEQQKSVRFTPPIYH